MSKHASHAVQQLSTVHWLHVAEGVSTGVLHTSLKEGLGAPIPMPIPLHWVRQLFDQHVSMPFARFAPVGYRVSHAVMHAPILPVPLDDEPLLLATPLFSVVALGEMVPAPLQEGGRGADEQAESSMVIQARVETNATVRT